LVLEMAIQVDCNQLVTRLRVTAARTDDLTLEATSYAS
jgi:hypothetical protein